MATSDYKNKITNKTSYIMSAAVYEGYFSLFKISEDNTGNNKNYNFVDRFGNSSEINYFLSKLNGIFPPR